MPLFKYSLREFALSGLVDADQSEAALSSSFDAALELWKALEGTKGQRSTGSSPVEEEASGMLHCYHFLHTLSKQ